MAVLAHEHEAKPEDRLALAIRSDRPTTDFVADLHVAYIHDANRDASLGRYDDLLDLFNVYRPSDTVDQQHLAATADVATADVLVVLLERLDHLVKREAVFDQTLR